MLYSLVQAVVLLLVFSGDALSRDWPVNLFCNYNHAAYANEAFDDWQLKDEPLEIKIVNINIANGTATIVGNIGAGEIQVRAAERVLNFFEITLSGNVNYTSVFFSGQDQYNHLAVQSRHQAGLVGGPTVSQWLGTCREAP